jgi:hypothetical protein
MSYSYSEASFIFNLSADHKEFAYDVIEIMLDKDSDFSDLDQLKKAVNESNDAYTVAREIVTSFKGAEYVVGCVELGFEYEDSSITEGIWMYTEESFESAKAAIFVHQILKYFNLNYSIFIEVAHTCDRRVVGAFGGHAAFVTKFGIEWHDPILWKEKQEKLFQERLNKDS